MKKLFLILLTVASFLSISPAQAVDWAVVCVKQGPARGYVAGNLRPGHIAKPLRMLDPLATTIPSVAGNGYPVPPRSLPQRALVAEQSDISGDMNFFALGFGGQIVMRSSEWIMNGPGTDFTVFETTWGDPSCRPSNSEQALIEISEDGVNWMTPGSLSTGLGGAYNSCYNGSFDITPLMKIQFIRITDRTNPDWRVQGDGNDGYDVDGIVVNYSLPPTAFSAPQSPICDYQQGVASQYVGAAGNFPGRGIVSTRKNFSKANINEDGFPTAAMTNPGLRDSGPASGSYNFFSLGFGGWACLQLPYTVFNGPGPEFYSFETTWNNQPCPNYPERANVSVSVDGTNWSSTVLICKDALGIVGTSSAIDLSSFGPEFSMVNFIRFQEASNPADFGGGADGYDMDNIVISQLPPPTPSATPTGFSCETITSNRIAIVEGQNTYMDGGIPEEMFPLEIVGGNVVTDKLSFFATIAEEGTYHYTVRSYQGTFVSEGLLQGSLFETPTTEVDVRNFSNGVYFLTLSSNTTKETVKFVKN
jgi:hypothetical protein